MKLTIKNLNKRYGLDIKPAYSYKLNKRVWQFVKDGKTYQFENKAKIKDFIDLYTAEDSRSECEKIIIRKLQEIYDVYHRYNPDGNYLGMSIVIDGHYKMISVHNEYFDNDKEHPINSTEIEIDDKHFQTV